MRATTAGEAGMAVPRARLAPPARDARTPLSDFLTRAPCAVSRRAESFWRVHQGRWASRWQPRALHMRWQGYWRGLRARGKV